jgi:hypothetical protein
MHVIDNSPSVGDCLEHHWSARRLASALALSPERSTELTVSQHRHVDREADPVECQGLPALEGIRQPPQRGLVAEQDDGRDRRLVGRR